MIFKDKVVMITGGTGSLGKYMTSTILKGKYGLPKKIIIFSRDEDKQHSMRMSYRNLKESTDEVIYHLHTELIDFHIGDVRDYDSIVDTVRESDIVIHAAALKQVPVCEYFPNESVKTNINGITNIVRACRGSKVETVVSLSSDKACKPINVYGMCKAIQERITIEANLRGETRFVGTRYGNVVASRGSVVPLFAEQIAKGISLTITTPEMTRFLLTLDEACQIVIDAISSGLAGDTYIPIANSCNIVDLAEVMMGDKKLDIKYIGIRPGEKIHEIMVSEDELSRTIKWNNYYIIRSILPEVSKNGIQSDIDKEYSSADHVMGKVELKSYLEKIGVL